MRSLVLLLALVACTPKEEIDTGAHVDTGDTHELDTGETDETDETDETGETGDTGPVDADGDGAAVDVDCDDADAARFPGADETCNGVDDDCDDATDEDATDAPAWYADLDGDAHGDGNAAVLYACGQPVGYAATDDDCDDGDAAFHPGADESDCTDPADYNCDGSSTYVDADGDGFAACEDCDDTSADVRPDAIETCNGVDDDCDTTTDEDDAADALTWYADVDGDTFGDLAATTLACEAPAGFVADTTDCDDTTATRHPGAPERCDDEDDDCDTEVDEEAIDLGTWYADADGDTYGDPDAAVTACDAPATYVTDASDCDDTLATVNPAAVETCDDVDQDCDGTPDDAATDAPTWYTDADADGFGDAATAVVTCDAPTDTVDVSGDCADTDAARSPSASETRGDGVDQDCDGSDLPAIALSWCNVQWPAETEADPGVASETIYGQVYAAGTTEAAGQGEGLLAQVGYGDSGSDPELDASWAWTDADYIVDDGNNDEYGASLTVAAAGRYAYAYRFSGDDGATWTYCDTDGSTPADAWDPAAQGELQVGSDDDGDGELALADGGTDCDDTRADVYTGAPESCDDVDNDCDSTIDEAAFDPDSWYADADGDTYGDPSVTQAACDTPAGYVANFEDCDDTEAALNPAAAEVCDGDDVDEDCDGYADDDDPNVTGRTTWYADVDGDGYGDPSDTELLCEALPSYVAAAGDCDDGALGENPGASETRGDGIDQDCDGSDLPAITIGWCNTQWPSALTTDAGVATSAIYGQVWADGTTHASGQGEGLLAQVGYGAAGTPPDATWTWTDATYNTDSGNNDEYQATLTVMVSGTYAYAFRFSGDDGATWSTCDLGGTASGEAFDTAGAGSLTVTGTDADHDGQASLADGGADCDDTDAAVYSGATEVCENGVDDDCSDTIDCEPAGTASVSTDAGIVMLGSVANENVGASFAVGDWNGDGVDDLSLAQLQESGSSKSNLGKLHLFDGPLAGTESVATANSVVDATALSSGDAFGTSQTRIPDMDGDGDDELLVGSHNVNAAIGSTTYTDAGQAWLFRSASTATAHTSASTIFTGTTTRDYLGVSVTTAGDHDGDGYADLAVGAYAYDAGGSDAGAVGLWHGGDLGATESLTDASVLFVGGTATGYFGTSTSSGDLDGDGTADLVVGAPASASTSTPGTGVVYVFAGPFATDGTTVAAADAGVVLTGTLGARLGYAVVVLGDTDGDGLADLAVGSDYADDAASDAGAVYVWTSAVATGASPDTTFLGATASDYAGRTVAAPGDVNGDGFAELLFGASGYDTPMSGGGAAYLAYGPLPAGTTSATAADAAWTGSGTSDGLGYALAGGDVDADGYADLLLGTIYHDLSSTTTNVGGAWIIQGSGE